MEVKKIDQGDSSWAIGPKDFIFKYLRYLPWVVICGLIGFVLAYIKLRYVVPIYRVQSSLLIKNQDNGIDKDQRFQELLMPQTNANLNNEMAILRSRPLLKRVARDLDLQKIFYNEGNLRSSLVYPNVPIDVQADHLVDPSLGFKFSVNVMNDDQFTLNEDKTVHNFGESLNYGGNLVRVTRVKTVDLKPYARPKFLVIYQPLSAAAEFLLGGLRVGQPDEQATILTLTFDSENTTLGLDVLNTLMSVYDSLIIEDKNRIAVNTENFIDTRLSSLRTDLNGIEGNMKSNLERNQTFDIEDQSKKYFENISDANKKLIELEVKIKVVDMLADYVDNKGNVYKLVPTSLGIDEPTLLQLVNEYNRIVLERESNLRTTSANNAIILGLNNTLEKIRGDIREALKNIKSAYGIAYNRLEQDQTGMKSEMRSLPGKSMQFINVQRQQKILEDLYSFLLQKKIESSISSASTISNSKVLEPALGQANPVSPIRSKIYSFYLMTGLLIPVGFIFLIEVLRDKVGSRQEVEKRTSAPILGEIGHSADNKTSLVVMKNSRTVVAEQFRIVRTSLQYVAGTRQPLSILVTSSFSGEGKSFISTNLGAVMALSGKKTVIMEFDIRKPKIVSGLDLKRKAGITNYIIGKASFKDMLVQVEGMENLYVIPCGPIPPNPAEMLLDERLDQLMEEVKAKFEVIIMDTAPVGLVSDAFSLSRFAACTVYVIRQGYTFRKQLRLIEDLYQEKKLPALSLLLNDVKQGGGYYGGYGYYGSGYGYGVASGYFDETSSTNKSRNPLKRAQQWWNRLFL